MIEVANNRGEQVPHLLLLLPLRRLNALSLDIGLRTLPKLLRLSNGSASFHAVCLLLQSIISPLPPNKSKAECHPASFLGELTADAISLTVAYFEKKNDVSVRGD